MAEVLEAEAAGQEIAIKTEAHVAVGDANRSPRRSLSQSFTL
jgi:hypothetical protein